MTPIEPPPPNPNENSMTEPQWRSDIKVVFDDASNKGDRGIALRAWAVHPDLPPSDKKDDPEGWRRVIRAMIKNRHGSAFEGGYLSVYVEVPAVVWWEWTRHRFMSLDTEDFGFNLESGRYRVLDGEFYRPPTDRPCFEPENFKPMRPLLEQNAMAHEDTLWHLEKLYGHAWKHYQGAIENGIAREVARLMLPFGIYYAGYVSANPRTWLHFFSLRKRDDRAQFVTYPQSEIQSACEQCEELFAERWPLVYEQFNECGRVAP